MIGDPYKAYANVLDVNIGKKTAMLANVTIIARSTRP